VSDLKVTNDLPIFRLNATANVDLILDNAIRIDRQVLVSIGCRAYLERRAHERKLGEELLVATGQYVDGFVRAAVDFRLDFHD
jgi:hypothetical protein